MYLILPGVSSMHLPVVTCRSVFSVVEQGHVSLGHAWS